MTEEELERLAAITVEELIADIADIEEALIDAGMTNADMLALLEAVLKHATPVKH